jgi:hypothetical protein
MDTAIELTRPRKALWRRCLRRTRAWFRLQMWQHIRETYHIGDHTQGP